MHRSQKIRLIILFSVFFIMVALSPVIGGCITEIVAYQQQVLAIKIDERLQAVENGLVSLDEYAALINSGETENAASHYVGEALSEVQAVEEELTDLIFQLSSMDVTDKTASEAHDKLIKGLSFWKEAAINYRRVFKLAHEYEVMEDYVSQLSSESDRAYIQNQMADNKRRAQDTYNDIIKQLNEGGNLMELWLEAIF